MEIFRLIYGTVNTAFIHIIKEKPEMLMDLQRNGKQKKKGWNPFAEMFTQNTDMAAWLTIDVIIIDDIIIDYPVMQTLEVENHYLYLDFMGMKIKRDT